MNANFQEILKTTLLAKPNSSEYLIHWGHWIPQYDYAYNDTGRRYVKHVLHNELLSQEFSSLMKAYGLNLTLPHTGKRSRTGLGAKNGMENLTLSAIELIEVVFEKDFAEFGYEQWSRHYNG